MYKFLLIEDSIDDANAFKDTVKRLNLEEGKNIYELDVANTYEEGRKGISKEYDGIIIDIKLDKGCSGMDIIQEITNKLCVPVVIFTGTPDIEPTELPIKVYKKGEAEHKEILENLITTIETGIFNVLGRTGKIEVLMTQIFWKNLYPNIEIWEEKKKRGLDTEKILLRYAVSHIQEFIDKDLPEYSTEEMYIYPPVNNEITTGSIIKLNSNNQLYIVLSPPCDLEIRDDGSMNTDSILICEIENQNGLNNVIKGNKTSKRSIQNAILPVLKNNSYGYYHWLPKNALFEGGYINFRKVSSINLLQLKNNYSFHFVKVQSTFVKNILNRFSAYYARQGQPDFNFAKEAEIIVDELTSDISDIN